MGTSATAGVLGSEPLGAEPKETAEVRPRLPGRRRLAGRSLREDWAEYGLRGLRTFGPGKGTALRRPMKSEGSLKKLAPRLKEVSVWPLASVDVVGWVTGHSGQRF